MKQKQYPYVVRQAFVRTMKSLRILLNTGVLSAKEYVMLQRYACYVMAQGKFPQWKLYGLANLTKHQLEQKSAFANSRRQMTMNETRITKK